MSKPIMSEKEAQETREFLINTTANVLKIPVDEATRRVEALFQSGLLDVYDPMTVEGQMIIDAFLSMPSGKYAHLKPKM